MAPMSSDTPEMRIALRFTSQRDRQHLEQVIGMADRRAGLRLRCSDEAGADIVLVRRGEPGSNSFLCNDCDARRPVPVVYTDNPRESHRWRLPSPARTADLIALVDTLRRHLLAAAPASPPDISSVMQDPTP
ncbi:MAG: hypothetical protein ACOY3X_11600 [Pseudomonadota bacterium]